MKQAEFLNLDTKQVQWLDASLEHPNLVKVPEGADTLAGHKSGDFCYFWDHSKMMFIGTGKSLSRFSEWESIKKTAEKWLSDFEDANGFSIIWQRNSLQEKIDEALSVLNVSKAQLSFLLGREKSYVKRLLAKDRNVTENTKSAVIDQLEQLIRVQEYEQPEPAQIDHEAIIAKLNLQLFNTSKLLDQAVAEKNVWRLKLQDQRNLSWFLTLVVVVMAFVWIYSVWGV